MAVKLILQLVQLRQILETHFIELRAAAPYFNQYGCPHHCIRNCASITLKKLLTITTFVFCSCTEVVATFNLNQFSQQMTSKTKELGFSLEHFHPKQLIVFSHVTLALTWRAKQ